MAAIIAQMTRAARTRRDRRTYGINKCMYTLHRFDTNGFNPWVHNKYCVDKARWERQVRMVQEEEEIILRAWKDYQVKYIDSLKAILFYRSTCLPVHLAAAS